MSNMNLAFTSLGKTPSGKTERWKVNSAMSGVLLGHVTWYSQWRRYVFTPAIGSSLVFDAQCLTELGTFCRVKTEMHKEKL